MFACQGKHEQYDTTERKKQLGFGVKANQNKVSHLTELLEFMQDVVFHKSMIPTFMLEVQAQ